ncbi:MAG: dicarboxylate/amino acid:cation symporter [bacterium]
MKLHWQILVALGLGAKRNWPIFIALLAGVLVGAFFPILGAETSPFYKGLWVVGQIFIRLIQMVVIPLVVSAIVVGIASLGDSKQLGKIGLKMVIYYFLITVTAVSIGAVLASLFHPGTFAQGLINPDVAKTVQDKFLSYHPSQLQLAKLYLDFIPSNPFTALASPNFQLIPVILFVIIFGSALAFIGEINRPVVSFFESVFAATMKVTDWVMILAAPGIFSLTAYTVAKAGPGVFEKLSFYMATLGIGLAIQLFVTYPLMLRIFSKVNFVSLIKAVAEAMMVAFGTASSSATLPVTIACCERRAGISNKICSFVLPLGATMNMDATAMFQVIAVLFLTQAYGIHLGPAKVIMVAILAMVASSTAAGIPSGGWITLALILSGIGLSVEQVAQGFTIIFVVDRILDMFRTVINVTSDTVVAAIIADNEGELDHELLGNQEVWKEVV